jgi:hypothetical protein
MVVPAPRKELARKLVEYALPIEPVLSELSAYPWDCDSPLFVITPAHLVSILDRYLAGELTTEQVERWGNLVEMRDDLDLAEGTHETIREVIHELANPLLTEPLSKESALRMRHALATSTI